MSIDPKITKVQPGDDRAMIDQSTPVNMLSFDLETPETAPDEYQRAAARRISTTMGAPDPDGRMWRPDQQGFATGGEYLDFMRGMLKSGDIFEYAATPELKEFAKADPATRLTIARKARGFAETAADAVSKAVTPEGYGLPDSDPRLAGAPKDVIEANGRMRMRKEVVSLGDSDPTPEETADRAAVDGWRTQRDSAALVEEHHAKLLEKNVWHLYLALSPSLSEKGQAIAANAFKDRKLAASDIADFQRLDEKEQAVIVKLARASRNPVAGTLFNTLGDAGIGFLNGILMTPVKATRQLQTIDTAIFGTTSGLADTEALNRRARTEQRLMEALDDPAGVNPSGATHGYLARAIVGAASTIPYMAYASIPYAGAATVGLDFMQQLDERIAQSGGDVHGKGPEWMAQKAVYGALYAGIEKVSALPIFKESSDIALKMMFIKLATKHGAAAAEKVALHVGKDTFVESLEESAQRVIEEHAVSVGLDKGPGWREAVKGGSSEFAESLGTMGIISTVGAARQGVSARSLRGRQSLADFTTDSLRRESFLLSENPYAGQSGTEQRDKAVADVHAQLNTYRSAWESGGLAALEKRRDLSSEEAAVLSSLFEADNERAAVENFIAGRNIVSRTQAAEAGAPSLDATPESIRELVSASGGEAAAQLEQIGFTSDGAARVASYFSTESANNKRAARVLDDIRASLARDWADPDASAQRADEAQAAADPLQPLRSLYQRAGTRDGAAKAFKDVGFTDQQAQGMAAAFHEERALATSPQAAAAFRAFYLDTSEEETAADRLKRLTGFEAAPAPDQGDGAARLTLRDTDGTARGSILYLPGQAEAFDPESEHAGEAVQQATGGIITATDWAALTPEQRRQTAQDMGIRADGGFIVTDETDPTVRANGAQADLLTGRLTLAPDAPSATLYHEAAHAWLAVMRQAGKLTDADVKKLQAAYGVAPDNKAWFNEEALADDIREMGAAADFTPDRPLAARFLQAIRSFAGAARKEQAQRTAATAARQALYESIVYGRAFDGVGDFSAAAAQKQAAPDTASPVAGASSAAVPKTETAAESGTADTQPVKNQVTAVSQKQEKTAAPNARKRVDWSAATPQGNLRLGGYWLIAPRNRFISDTDPRYDGSLQDRTRDTTTASAEQVAAIAAPGGLDALRLLDAPDTANGAPVAVPVTLKDPATGKDETYYMIISGNGRFRALDKIDADNRGDEYRNPVKLFADEKNIPYEPADMTAEAQPRLVRVITKKPVDSTLQQIASLSNQNAVLQMSDAEQASSDAKLIARDDTAGLFSANKDGLPSKTGSDAFFSWFARATGDASLLDSKNNPTDTARGRARRAMLAFAIGQGETGKPTVAAFTENADALGLERQRDALLMSAGTLSAIENTKPDYGLSGDLSRAAAAILSIARDRKAGKTASAETFLQQGDMLNPLPAATAMALRILDSSRPAEGIAEAFRRYADLASKIDTETPDMFGEPPTPKDALLQKAFDDTAVPEGIRYSIALAARRYALSVNMPAEGEKLLARQLEFLFSRQMDPEYREKTETANRKRQATAEGKRKAAEDSRLHGIRNATAEALNNPGSPEAWQQAFDKSGDTVSRIVHDFFIQDGPQRFPQTYSGKSIIGLKINNSHDVAALLMPLRNPYQESIKVVLLDENNRVLGAEVVTVGLLNATASHPREMFKKGIKLGAKKIIFSHNHPSGNTTPSDEDRKETNRLAEAGRILGIEYFDHIITNGNTFYSFKDAMTHTVANKTPDWEAVPAGSGDKISKAYDAASLANVLRQSQGDYIHAILLDTSNRIAGVHRMPYDAKTTTPTMVMRSVFKAAAGNATYAIILDLTADGITRETAESLHRVIKEQSRVMGMDLYDSIYQEQGWAASIRKDDGHMGLVLPLTSKAAENKDTRYSVSASNGFDWIRDYYDESYGDQQAGEERDTRESSAEEYAAVEAEHTHPNGKRKDSWMLAPNGKRTNLDGRQWVLVRTPSFKAWFGDWEVDPANSSKVIDENGEPMVVYHGTQEAGFTEFIMPTDSTGGNERLAMGHYFSSRVITAYTYAGSFDFAGEFVETDEFGKPIDMYPGIYPAFLNIRKLDTYDYDGSDWDKYRDGKSGEKTTRSLAARSVRSGADGVLFKDVVDIGGEYPDDGNLLEPDDVYAVFSNSNIKSAIHNTGTFSPETDDIRYSIQTRSLEPLSIPEHLAEVAASTSVSALSQTKFKTERGLHKEFRDAQDWEGAEAYARTLTKKNDTRLLGQYLLAKYHGDIEAAEAVVEKWAKPSEALRLKLIIGNTGLLKPVVTAAVGQKEGNRYNALPIKYADWLAKQLGGYTSQPIMKIKGDPNTGAAMADRTSRDYEFTGGDDVDSASPILLVDDVWTSGQTLWTAYEHLKATNPDAHVVAFAAIASGRYGKNVRPTQKQLTAFWEKSKLTTLSFKERIGNEIGNLIGSEIQAYILTGKSGPDGAAEFFGPGKSGTKRDGGRNIKEVGSPDVPQVRYALDITGRAYAKEDVLKAWMAHAVMTGASFPSKSTVARLAENIGVQSFDYESLALSARALAASTEDEAIRKAAASGDAGKTAYAIGELARQSARAYVRSGAREGERLAQSADRIRGLTEDNVRRAMQLMTGADYADIETDTAIDIALSILAADPKKFEEQQRQEEQAAAALAAAAGADEEETPAEPSRDTGETDEEAPDLTDKQRAEIIRKRKEREDRIQGYLDAAAKRGARNRFRDEERRNRKTANDKADRAEQAAAGADAASGDFIPELTPEQEEAAAIPVNFADRWEAAAFLRVWALDRFSRDNPNRPRRDLAKDRLAVEFYRKTAVRELTALARKLLEPGYPRETVIAMIGDIVPNLSANQIERRTAHVFGLINRHAVREKRQSLVKKFRAEVKRQFVKGAIFEELGVDLGRVVTGAVEEDARYVMRVCELSDRAFDGDASALQKERNRLNAILAEREAMTGEDGQPLATGSDDMQTRLAHRQLGLLDKYGGMVDMMPGEILDLTGAGLANFAQEAVALRERWEAYDKLVASIRDPLAAAIARGIDDPTSEETAAGALADSLTGMLRLRLDFLTRYAEPAKREAARAAIADFMDLLARGNTDYAIALQDDEAALILALSEIFVRPDGKPDRSRIRAYLKRLDDKIPYELSTQLTRQGMQGRMTYGQMLQLLASLDQWASYKDNIIRHDRKGQAALIRSFVYADTKTGETRSALTNEDTQLLEWLRRRFYNDKRDAISVVTERIAGRPVDSPDPLYHPVRMQQLKKAALHVGQGAWQPLAGVFSRRVKNKLDFDETASILDVFHDRSRETALLTAFSERGMVIREILTSAQFQDAVRRFHSPEALSRILKQTEQTLNGGRPRTQTDAQTAAAVIAMRATTYVGLGWNFMSAAKQTVSLPVFANVMGFKKLLGILGGPIDKDVIRRLRESDEYRIRYGTGPASGMDIGTKAAYDSPKTSAFKTFFADWGLTPNRKVDWFISAWVGQGIYRDLKASYMDKGMSDQEADRRAISETFSVIEETQQSGRTENTTALTREHGVLGKLLTQFATSPLQQMQYEIKSFREWRDLAANNGPEANTLEARNRFMRALVINHVIVPGAMAAVTALFKAVTGDEPEWDKEGFWWTVLIASLMGQFGRIFFLGAVTEETLRALFLRERPRMGQLVPAEGAVRFAANLAYPVRDIVTWDEEHFKADIMRALKSTAASRLPIKIYENYMGEEKK